MITLVAALVLSAPVQDHDFFDWGSKYPKTAVLFNGKNLDGWKGYKQPNPPSAWKAINGELVNQPGKGDSGDICTVKEFGDFELTLEWNIAPNGNSGIIYRAGEDYETSWQTGPEYQVLDDYRGGPGKVDNHSAGALYDLYVPTKLASHAPGKWNKTKIVWSKNRIEHWLNGTKIVECVVGSPEWNARIEKSKFRSFPLFARKPKGSILLQDHGGEVRYRNVRIKEF